MGVKLHERTLPSGKKQLFLDVYHKGQRKKETLDLELTGDRKADRLLVGFATFASNYYIGINAAEKERKLPVVLSETEVRGLFDALGNIKHRIMMMLVYSGGLRVGELVRLKPEEQGTDIRFIQELLGHGSVRTTEINTYVSKRTIAAIRSPIEQVLHTK